MLCTILRKPDNKRSRLTVHAQKSSFGIRLLR